MVADRQSEGGPLKPVVQRWNTPGQLGCRLTILFLTLELKERSVLPTTGMSMGRGTRREVKAVSRMRYGHRMR